MTKYKLNIGDVYTSNCGIPCKVVERIDGKNVVIEWQDEFKHKQIARPERVMTGKVYNPYFRSTYGVGYPGYGEYLPARNKAEYSIWKSMFTRCYSSGYHEYKATYKGCTVCEEWHNFQNFAKWCNEQRGFNLDNYEVDKDLLCVGNKVYSPETCCIVPNYINSLFSVSDANRGELPLGVSLGIFSETKGQRYIAQIKNGKKWYLGSFSSAMSAHKAWQLAKIEVVKEAIALYKEEPAFIQSVEDRLLAECTLLAYNAENGIETRSFYGR